MEIKITTTNQRVAFGKLITFAVNKSDFNKGNSYPATDSALIAIDRAKYEEPQIILINHPKLGEIVVTTDEAAKCGHKEINAKWWA